MVLVTASRPRRAVAASQPSSSYHCLISNIHYTFNVVETYLTNINNETAIHSKILSYTSCCHKVGTASSRTHMFVNRAYV